MEHATNDLQTDRCPRSIDCGFHTSSTENQSRLPKLLTLLFVFVVASSTWASPPNVVIILADDQSYRDFGFMGNAEVHTPNLDALAKSAARYPNGYVPMSVCRPSLATILTGLYPHQHGIHFNHPPPGLSAMRQLTGEQYRNARAITDKMVTRVPTLPRILAKHGYACLQTGKHWEGDFRTAGFTDGMTLAKPSNRLSPITGTREQVNGDWVAHGNGDAGLVIGRETMQPIDTFIEQHAGRKPFFVWYAPFLPHTPFDAPPQFHLPYANKNVPDHLRPYYAEINRFDATVGHLLSSLKQHDVDENTLIVFAADNGFRPDKVAHGRHNKRSKLSPFEDGLRTPILIRQLGKTKPAEHTNLVGTTDLLPTILSATGLSNEVTSEMPGIDLMPSARGERELPVRPAFGAIYPNDATILNSPATHVRARWIRSGRYKLILPGPVKSTIAPSLFDLQSDPLESNNLFSRDDQSEIVSKLTVLLDNWWTL